MMATAERPCVERVVHDTRECHKQHRRDASRISMLRRELEAARAAIDELEREVAALEAAADVPM